MFLNIKKSLNVIFLLLIASSSLLSLKNTQHSSLSLESIPEECENFFLPEGYYLEQLSQEKIQRTLFGESEEEALACLKNWITFNDFETLLFKKIKNNVTQETILMHAIHKNWYSVVQEIINVTIIMGAELFLPLMFQEDTFGFTAFMHAVRNNKLKIVSFFLDSINSYDLIQSILSKPSNQRDITDSLFFKNFGSTISTQLESACENSLIEKILIKKDHCWERNAISHAIAGNSPVMLSLLINTIHDQSSLLEKLLTDYDKFGQTPLMLTIKKNNSQLLFELLHITRKNPSLFEKILYQKDRCRLFNSYELAHENNNDMLDELLWWKNNIES